MSVQSSSRNEHVLKRVDLQLFLRFLTAISETTTIGITSLQMKTGTNQTVCVKYVTLLEKFGLVKLNVHESSKQIQITDRGRQALLAVSSYFQ
jgi:predicted transcriptional regulator